MALKLFCHKKTAFKGGFFDCVSRLIATTAATTATAVAAAITAAAISTAATTTVATATRAWGASFHGASNVHGQSAATHALAMQAGDSSLRFVSTAHFHKAEAFGAAGIALHHDLGGLHLAECRKLLLQVFIAH